VGGRGKILEQKQLPTNEDWADENNPIFYKISILRDRIDDQNKSYLKLVGKIQNGQVDMDHLKDFAISYLKSTQANTFEELKRKSEEAPYDELAYRHQSTITKMADLALAARLSEEERRREKAQIEIISKCIPGIPIKFGEIALGLDGCTSLERQQKLELQEKIIAQEYQEIDGVFQPASKAWPIPMVIYPGYAEKYLEYLRKQTKQTFSFVRETKTVIPIKVNAPEPKRPANTVAQEGKTKESVHERISDASKLLAIYLSNNPEQSFTYSELSKAVYGDSCGLDKDNSEIRTMVYNYLNGNNRIMTEILTANGLALQPYEQSDKIADKRIARFRVVRLSKIDNSEQPFQPSEN
jgi:hypothetical protein